ncbi:MAG: glucose-6-phosphate isomerase [Bacilli bacterium]|nr:glucose-6-phosphate isomerase [Bacilli bacterium]
MVTYKTYGSIFKGLDFSAAQERCQAISDMIDNKTGEGNDFLGWIDFASRMKKSEIDDIIKTAQRIRENYECLVVIGIGGSYLGARAVIEAIKGLYPVDNFEIIYLGNTLSSTYTAQVLKYLENKKFACNVISKSGMTTEPAIAFRLVKDLLIRKYGVEYLKDAIIATTDSKKGALRHEAEVMGYKTFTIPDDIGGRFSVITPVGLLPIAVSNIDIRELLEGVKQGEKDYSVPSLENPAYKYAVSRALLSSQAHYNTELFVTYGPHFRYFQEWLKQLIDESEGKENRGILCSSAVFTTDLHSLGQFVQQGSPTLFETIVDSKKPLDDITIPHSDDNLDNLNYLEGKKMSFVNTKAYHATLDAHSNGHTPCNVISIDEVNPFTIGNLIYFFFRSTAFGAYYIGVNPFNQPGVEIYKKNMFKLLGKPENK